MHHLPIRSECGHLHVVVEVPAGSTVKLKYDQDLGAFLWSRRLSAGVSYPYDYGFVPGTRSGDGDALDALVYSEVGSYPGVVVPSRIIGALQVEQQRDHQPIKRNDRLLVVPAFDHQRDGIRDISDVAPRALEEIEEFFRASLVLTGKRVRFCGWADAAQAEQLVDAAVSRLEAVRA
ncbi:MAG TPA: inorganic diphosphatase [Kofleriaceae bacterium]|nr:inorganic diphosphatase [Kofleriaceae bacterium]